MDQNNSLRLANYRRRITLIVKAGIFAILISLSYLRINHGINNPKSNFSNTNTTVSNIPEGSKMEFTETHFNKYIKTFVDPSSTSRN